MRLGDVLRPRRRLWRRLLRRADAARDQGRYRTAAELYAEVLDLRPDHAGIHVQRGHMLKDSGQFADAERAYRRAIELGADRADLSLNMGHLFKAAGRWEDARREYGRAAGIAPGHAEPTAQLAALAAEQADRHGATASDAGVGRADEPDADGELALALAPGTVNRPAGADGDVVLLRCGRRATDRGGARRTLSGVEALHGYVLSATPLDEVRVIVNGVETWREALRGPYPVTLPAGDGAAKYVFNCWVDVSSFHPGTYALELRFAGSDHPVHSWHDRIAVAPAEPEVAHPASDALVDVDRSDPRSVEAQVRARASRIRTAERSLLPGGIRRLLAMRVDQLGDLVASVPALRRLRELFPRARIVLLATSANADFARTLLDLVDEVIAIDFPDDPRERRRVMPVDEQRRLRDRLRPYEFDLAIDLARSDVSRPLLALSGARLRYGMGGEAWPYLSGGFSLDTPDPWSGQDVTPHAAKTLAMIDAVAALFAEPAPPRRRADLSRNRLVDLGLGGDVRFAVLHTGARIRFSRWPHYGALVSLLLDRTDLRIVVIGPGEGIPADGRVTVLEAPLPFDQFDALLSFASVVVGNDSGPKHLAALRGTPTVTIYSARIDWREWGPERRGTIISRKLPCAGCAILHEPENCAKGFSCITDIRPEEVSGAVLDILTASISPSGGST